MNIDELKAEYLNLTKICAEIDYSDKKSVKRNNSAVKRMYKIMNLLSENNCGTEILNFSELLAVAENKTNLWVAAQMLEKLNVDKKTEQNALKIIKKAAKGNGTEGMGFQSWLAEYKLQN
jgi:transcription initiation factor TFIIIB Brf1 subunit/transcription initiation factor TFIIB